MQFAMIRASALCILIEGQVDAIDRIVNINIAIAQNLPSIFSVVTSPLSIFILRDDMMCCAAFGIILSSHFKILAQLFGLALLQQ